MRTKPFRHFNQHLQGHFFHNGALPFCSLPPSDTGSHYASYLEWSLIRVLECTMCAAKCGGLAYSSGFILGALACLLTCHCHELFFDSPYLKWSIFSLDLGSFFPPYASVLSFILSTTVSLFLFKNFLKRCLWESTWGLIDVLWTSGCLLWVPSTSLRLRNG